MEDYEGRKGDDNVANSKNGQGRERRESHTGVNDEMDHSIHREYQVCFSFQINNYAGRYS